MQALFFQIVKKVLAPSALAEGANITSQQH